MLMETEDQKKNQTNMFVINQSQMKMKTKKEMEL